MGSLFFSMSLAATLFTSVTTDLPQIGYAYQPVLAEGALPEEARPWGTVYIAWSDSDHLHLTEWDLANQGIIRDAAVTTACSLVNLVRVGDRLLFACTSDDVRVLETDLDGKILAEGTAGEGELASIDADGEHVVVGQLVDQTPVLPMRGTRVGPPRSAVKVTVLERRTLATTASRMIRGDHLFYAHFMPDVAAHSIALLGDRVVVQVPDDKPRVETLSVRTLAPIAQRELKVAVPSEFQHSMPVSRVGDQVVVDGGVYDKNLKRTGDAPMAFYMGSVVARDPSTKTWLVAGDAKSTKSALATTEMYASSVVWSHGRAVAIAPHEDDKEPARIRVWNLPR